MGYHGGGGLSSSHGGDDSCGSGASKVTGGCVGPRPGGGDGKSDVMFGPCDGQLHVPHGGEWLRSRWFWRVFIWKGQLPLLLQLKLKPEFFELGWGGNHIPVCLLIVQLVENSDLDHRARRGGIRGFSAASRST